MLPRRILTDLDSVGDMKTIDGSSLKESDPCFGLTQTTRPDFVPTNIDPLLYEGGVVMLSLRSTSATTVPSKAKNAWMWPFSVAATRF